MLYHEFEINGQVYKLRLGAKDIVQLERKLGGNPMNVFIELQDGRMPTLESVVTILQASLSRYHSNMNTNAVYDLYDQYIEDGGTFIDLIPVLLEVFKVSGFFSDDVEMDESNPN